jgi:HK97 gp10 family phage protein
MVDLRAWAMRKMVDSITKEIVSSIEDVVAAEANLMVRDMRGRVAKDTGTAESTIHAERGSNPNKISVTIKAGGAATTKQVRQGSGVAFDYATAIEWGTHHQAAQPFFFSTYNAHKRQAKEHIAAGIKGALGKAIAENKQ